MEKIKQGTYRHYKGNKYIVKDEAINSDTEEEMVLYQDLKGEKLWCRPKKIFLEKVEVKGEEVPRFEFESDEGSDSWQDKYLRALADYQNLSRQVLKEKQEFAKFATEDFLEELLPVYDHLKLSIKDLDESQKKNAWVVGVTYVLKQFKEVLAAKGISEIETKGQKFDHETMDAVEGEGEMVAGELKPGYKLHDKVIRPAKVTVKK